MQNAHLAGLPDGVAGNVGTVAAVVLFLSQLTVPCSILACSLHAINMTISCNDRSVFSSPISGSSMSSS